MRISLALLFSGMLCVCLGSLRLGIAGNATSYGDLHLVLAACLRVDYDGVVAVAHLKPRASLDLALFGQGRLLCGPPRPDSERALRLSQRRCPSERALLHRD